MSSRYVLIFIVLVLTLESALGIIGPVIKVFGKRSITDPRIERKYIDMNGSFLQTIKLRETYNGNGKNVITQVKVTGNTIFPQGTKVRLIDGGVGHKHVTLEFQSRNSEGIKVVVSIYGKLILG